MAPKQDVRSRAPRGTKIVTQAFFAALSDIGADQQAGVAGAALGLIRDTLKQRQAKAKLAAGKAKAPAKKKTATRKAAAARKAPAKRRASKK